MAKINIIIVNWNAGVQLSLLVSSIEQYHDGLVESVIIVDNGSTDNSLEMIEARIGEYTFPLHIIHNKENRGFAAACNQGAALGSSPYLLFLNPDTRLFENSLSMPLVFMQQVANERVGICGIQLIDEAGKISRSCARFPSVLMFMVQTLGLIKMKPFQGWSHQMEEWDHASTREVDQLIGAFFFVRADLFRAVNGFDERFFVYFEEVDFSLRAFRAGYKSIFLAEAQAFHAGGGTSQKVKANRLFYSLRSRLLYGFKHFSCSQISILLIVTLLIEPFSRLIYTFLHGDESNMRNTLTAYKMLWCDLSAIFRRGFR